MSAGKQARPGVFAELRRRRVLRTLALYIVSAWVLMQVADVLLPALDIPEQAIRYLLLAAVVGFPVALVFGWFFDISANGIQRTGRADAAEIEAALPLRLPDYLLLTALAAVLAAIIYGTIGTVIDLPADSEASTVMARAPRGDGPPMIGVLPFTHLGSSEDGEFFATGVHDDLLTRLSQIGALRVISRTSVLRYAGTTKAIPEIGRELRADAILEGGVRVAGKQIRINAQLIDARSDEHLWAETYDRELTASNIFEVQSEIARAIASALQATLSDEESTELTTVPTSNMAAYRSFHEAMQLEDASSAYGKNRQQFLDGLEKAFDLDPSFTRPMMEWVRALSYDMFNEMDETVLPRIEALIDRIGEVAPNSADHLAAQSVYMYYVLRDYEHADTLIVAAIQKAPSDTRLLEIHSAIQRRLGDWEGSLATLRAARELTPTNTLYAELLLVRLMAMHRYDEARRELQTTTLGSPAFKLVRSQLALAKDHKLRRYEQRVDDLAQEALKTPDLAVYKHLQLELWAAQMAQGRFDASLKSLEAVREDGNLPDQPWDWFSVNRRILEIQLYLRTDNSILLAERVAETKRFWGIENLSPEEYLEVDGRSLAAGAWLAIAEGRSDIALDRVSGAWKDPAADKAVQLHNRPRLCQILGHIGEAKEATDCLRMALDEPSTALHFLEPYSPAYDPIRTSPTFSELIQELRQEGWLPARR